MVIRHDLPRLFALLKTFYNVLLSRGKTFIFSTFSLVFYNHLLRNGVATVALGNLDLHLNSALFERPEEGEMVHLRGLFPHCRLGFWPPVQKLCIHSQMVRFTCFLRGNQRVPPAVCDLVQVLGRAPVLISCRSCDFQRSFDHP